MPAPFPTAETARAKPLTQWDFKERLINAFGCAEMAA
jgi:hypothetical protein